MPSNNLLKLLVPRGTALDSVALPLTNDTILHFLSLHSSNSQNNDDSSDSAVKLFAIQAMGTSTSTKDPDLLLQQVRDRLASSLQRENAEATSSWQSLRILRSAYTGRGTASVLQQRNSGLPLLDLGDIPAETSNSNADDKPWNRTGALKEIVIPSYPTDSYADGRSLFTTLQQSSQVHRPMPGLYQLPQGLCIRPLPSAKEDRNLPPPSLIFHTESLRDDYNDDETASFKIGFTGITGKGQLMLRCKHYGSWGVDVRMCSATKPSSMFSEAQESLLASSLKELQSAHVLSHRKLNKQDEKNMIRDEDPNINKMDCWVEFRATMKHPTGYIRR